MYCPNCGKEVTSDFCTNCGFDTRQPVNRPFAPAPPPKKKMSGCGCLAAVAVFFALGFILLLVVFGISEAGSPHTAVPEQTAAPVRSAAEETAAPQTSAVPQETETVTETQTEPATVSVTEEETSSETAGRLSYEDYVKAFETGEFPGVDPDFKAYMDEYERFFDRYISIMYNLSSDNTAGVVTDYFEMLEQYTEWTQKIEAVDTDKLSPADSAYYTYITLKVTSKMYAAALAASGE